VWVSEGVGEGVQVMNSVGVIVAVAEGVGGKDVLVGRLVRVDVAVDVTVAVQVGEAVGD
jgi:hypothetical protein